MNFPLPTHFIPYPWHDHRKATTMSDTALLDLLHTVIGHACAVAVVVSDSVEQERHTRKVLLPLLNGLYEDLESAEKLLNAWDEARRALAWPAPPATPVDDA